MRPLPLLEKLASCIRCRKLVIVRERPQIKPDLLYNPDAWETLPIRMALGSHCQDCAEPAGSWHYRCGEL